MFSRKYVSTINCTLNHSSKTFNSMSAVPQHPYGNGTGTFMPPASITVPTASQSWTWSSPNRRAIPPNTIQHAHAWFTSSPRQPVRPTKYPPDRS